ncbi:MAG: veratrol--corrinoid protein metyltransferase [Oscillospiraceae bacterium]|nr:veratrol--corrinoid protein metyltransferase [Oscillospiraceae bacterium]
MLTEKQNYLMLLNGEQPEWVPQYTFGPMPGAAKPVATHMHEPPILIPHRLNSGGKDIWGVNYIPTYETGNALIPEPDNFILKDIRQWRDVIKAPDVSGVDWEVMVKKHIEQTGIDRTQTALALNLHFGYFQHLMSFMGFSEGLMAMHEETDEVMELFDYICSFFINVAENVIDLYNPDILTLMDDTAAWGAPFISPKMYKDMLVPFHDRYAKMGRDRGLPMTMHNCGKCESIIEYLVEMGIKAWDPAQTCNDLSAVKEKYGNNFVIGGGWDGRGCLLDPDVTDEEIVASAEETFRKYAPGGGFMWCGGFLGPIDDAEVKRKNGVLHGAVDKLARSFYN